MSNVREKKNYQISVKFIHIYVNRLNLESALSCHSGTLISSQTKGFWIVKLEDLVVDIIQY